MVVLSTVRRCPQLTHCTEQLAHCGWPALMARCQHRQQLALSTTLDTAGEGGQAADAAAPAGSSIDTLDNVTCFGCERTEHGTGSSSLRSLRQLCPHCCCCSSLTSSARCALTPVQRTLLRHRSHLRPVCPPPLLSPHLRLLLFPSRASLLRHRFLGDERPAMRPLTRTPQLYASHCPSVHRVSLSLLHRSLVRQQRSRAFVLRVDMRVRRALPLLLVSSIVQPICSHCRADHSASAPRH